MKCLQCKVENSFGKWCENNKPYILDLWDYDKNNVSPYDITCATHIKYFFKCPNGKHDSILRNIDKITRRGDEIYCRQCDLEENSFGTWSDNNYPIWLQLWDYDKNDVSPYEILSHSGKKYWFKCPKGLHESSQKIIANITKRPKTLYCAQCNMFGQRIIDKFGKDMLDLLWDYNINKLSPFEISYGDSDKKIYINCLNNESHGSYSIVPSNFWQGKRCPKCNKENHISKFQNATEVYIERQYGYHIDHEYGCSITAYNPKTNRLLPYDNDVSICDKHLIIEVNGEQHYKVTGFARLESAASGRTTDEILLDTQYRDKLKMEYALSIPNYYYLELPYTAFEDDTYKQMIDESIHKILSLTTQN